MKKVFLILLICSIGYAQDKPVKKFYGRQVAVTTAWQKVAIGDANTVGKSFIKDLFIQPTTADTCKILLYPASDTTSLTYNNLMVTSAMPYLYFPVKIVSDTILIKSTAVTTVILRALLR
jgi:hypothetical protein